MSSDEDALILTLLLQRRKKKKRKYWVHPYSSANLHRSIVTSCTSNEMLMDAEKFRSFYRMSRETFQTLLNRVGPSIKKCNTKFRDAITPEEKLIITLRYFATGMSFKQLYFQFMRGASTIGQIVEEVSDSIWSCLHEEYLPIPSELTWIESARRFNELWNLPNCIGSIDGKHIRINCPAKTGSAFYNYKNYFSLQLLAVADADSNFIAIDVGDYGRNSDGGVFKNSSFGRNFKANTLNIPSPHPLPQELQGEAFPYYFVGDAAFPLSKNLLKPYPSRDLTNEKRIFNYRLSRARRSVECAFGILVSKFKLLEKPILCSPNKVDKIVKAICVLHNFVRQMDGKMSDVTCELLDSNNGSQMLENFHPRSHRSKDDAIELRERLCTYLNKPYAALPWQHQYCV